MSPDPSQLSYNDPTNPQGFNLFNYALNNPLAYIDPTGLTCQTNDNGDVYDDEDGKGCAIIDQQNALNPGLEIFNYNFSSNVSTASNTSNGDIQGGAPNKNVFGVTPKQEKDCLNAWSNSGLGKSVQFFSLYNLATNFKNAWKEWTLVPVGKGLFVGAMEKVSNALEGGEVVSVTTGTVETLSGPAASGLGSAVSAGAQVAPYGIPAATILDMNASAGCMGMQSNYFSSGQVGVF